MDSQKHEAEIRDIYCGVDGCRICSNRTRSWSSMHSSALPTHPTHPTEANCPEQCKMFREILDKMYQVHLDKNADYSPMNILGTGEVGLGTRIWDKVARLMNLLGFDVRTGAYEKPKGAKNESLDDTFMDLAVYAIIAQIYRAGKWGK